MQASLNKNLSIKESIQQLRDKRFIVILLVGFSSGFPWALHGSVLTLWLQENGFSRSTIGYIGAIASVYALNWMWAPLIDRVHIPFLHKHFDQRRAWILFTQAIMVIALIGMSRANPDENLLGVGAWAFLLALASATQDIAVDSYRIMLFKKEELNVKIPYTAALATAGWLCGYGFIGGALALWLGGESMGLSWPTVYLVMAWIIVMLMIGVSMCPRPEENEEDPEAKTGKLTFFDWLNNTIVNPFTEFFKRCGPQLAIAILLFLFSFRLGEAMLGRMSLLFYVEVGFSTDQIALYEKFFGGFTTIVFSLIGAFINSRYGVIRGMMVGGIAMAASNLMFAVMAQVGPEPWLFVITLLIDNFTQAFATVAAISFMSYFASRTYTGTQFALMTSVSNFGRTTLAAGSGYVVDSLGGNWSLFFIMTTLMVTPALCLLVWVGRLIENFNKS